MVCIFELYDNDGTNNKYRIFTIAINDNFTRIENENIRYKRINQFTTFSGFRLFKYNATILRCLTKISSYDIYLSINDKLQVIISWDKISYEYNTDHDLFHYNKGFLFLLKLIDEDNYFLFRIDKVYVNMQNYTLINNYNEVNILKIAGYQNSLINDKNTIFFYQSPTYIKYLILNDNETFNGTIEIRKNSIFLNENEVFNGTIEISQNSFFSNENEGINGTIEISQNTICSNENEALLEDSTDNVCYPKDQIIKKYKYNENTNIFEKCYLSCDFRSETSGNENDHKCEKCAEGYLPSNQYPGNCYKENISNIILNSQYDKEISIEIIKKVYKELKKIVSIDSNIIIETKNVNFQMSSLEIQKNSKNPNISSIDLGICAEILKKQEGLSEENDLIIIKIDIKSADLSKTFVIYEIINPITLNIINVEACQNIPIDINAPVTLDEDTKNIYYSLSQSGYNLFNLNDPFYNDICSTYTTENETDLTLIDRKKLIYDKNGNISMCQTGCTFKFYNLTNGKAKCDCEVQIKEIITIFDTFSFNSIQIANSFSKTLKNSNFLLLKCYKLVFSKKGQKNNIGSYLLSAINFFFIILIFIYIFNDNKKIDSIIQSILDFKLNYKTFHQIKYIKKFEKETEVQENKENIIKSKKKKNSRKKKVSH